MSDKQVSVIIPTYNSGNYIKDAVDSVLVQNYKNIEVIVVDDGSTDNTKGILSGYIERGEIHYSYQDNAGLAAARNTGIAVSMGEFIALLDADDVWVSDKISRQVELITASSADMVFADFHNFTERGIIIENKNTEKIEDGLPVTFHMLFDINNFIYPSTALIRRDVFSECGFFDTSLNAVEDYDMWLRIARKFCIIGINEPLSLIRIHESNMSKDISRMLDNELKVILKQRDDVGTLKYLRRRAKAFMLNADRCIYQSNRKQALRFFIYGCITYPFIFPDILVVMIKFILGGKLIDRLRSNLGTGLLKRLYVFFYKHY